MATWTAKFSSREESSGLRRARFPASFSRQVSISSRNVVSASVGNPAIQPATSASATNASRTGDSTSSISLPNVSM